MDEIKREFLDGNLKDYKKDDKHTVLRHALNNVGLMDVITSHDSIKDIDFNFDINIKTLPATNQKASGRCWIFAATNVLREIIAKECKMANFEFSQSFLALYDRLEKVNYVMEALIEQLPYDHDDRTVTFLLQSGIGDGGQWDMFVSLVEKYGLCPKNVFPETTASSATRETASLINYTVRKFAGEVNNIFASEGIVAARKLKEETLKKVYYLLIDAYGLPPETFDFEYTDVDGKYHLEKGFTPLSFKEKYVGARLHDFVSLINAPTKEKEFNKLYTIKYLGNVVGGKQVTHLNVTMERLKELVLKQLKDNQIVWFGSDVGNYGDRPLGIWDDNRFDPVTPFGLSWKMDKGDSLDYRASQMTHAMCITGVALQNGIPTKWKIENSWGSDKGQLGYYIMSASWFDQFVYQAVVDKKYLSKEELEVLKEKPIELKPWDPMGSLAD